MITDLSFANFKSWKNVDNLKLKKITGLFGSNSSGKTSILNLLLMLKQTVESPDRKQILSFGTERDYIQLGSYEDIIFNHTTESNLDITIGFSNKETLAIKDPNEPSKTLLEDKTLGFSTSISQTKNKRLFVNSLKYEFGGMDFFMRKQSKDKYDYALTANYQNNKTEKYIFKRTYGRGWPLPEPIKFYGFPDQTRTYYQTAGFLFDLQLQLETNFSKIFYLGPLRDYPKRQYTWSGTCPNDMGLKGEMYVDAILTARERGDKISRGKGKKMYSVEEYIAFWLKHLNLIDSFEVKEIKDGSNIYRVQVRRNHSSVPVPITDVGFGVSQILPVVTLCYYVPEGSTLIIEQPEIHLHPMVQSGMADIFIDAAQKRNLQLIIESHSEHLLRRLQLHVAEERISAEDVSLYFCSMDEDCSKLVPIAMDTCGVIKNWPKDFFGSEYVDMIKMNEAIMKRKNNGS
jgi:predicted ATPase